MNTDSPELERTDWRFRVGGDRTRCSSAAAKRYKIMEVRFGVREEGWEARACDSSEATRLKIMLCLDCVRERANSEGRPDG